MKGFNAVRIHMPAETIYKGTPSSNSTSQIPKVKKD